VGAALSSGPTSASFEGRPVPDWYDDAKLGIFVHWGIYSVPGWAPNSGSIWGQGPEEAKLPNFATSPYAEWYQNTMRIEGSATQRHHLDTYGAGFPYRRFAESFNREIEDWRPDSWAELFADAGAGYVVLTSKHHDGFLLWPSQQRSPVDPDFIASRDLVGELADAVRGRGLRMGLYYSGGIDWLYHDQVIASVGDFFRAIPPSREYLDYATRHWKELIDRYRPCTMWNDIGFPGPVENIEALFAYYYERVPDGIVNDRWRMAPGPEGLAPALPHDIRTPEYTIVPDIAQKKWESVRGIGNSFGFNRNEGPEEYLSARELVQSFIDIVSKNGNLLINVGPRADGSIPEIQAERLRALGAWLGAAGEAIYGTRPWKRAEGRTGDGKPVRFTAKGESLHAMVFDAVPGREVRIEGLGELGVEQVELLGCRDPIRWSRNGGHLRIALPEALPTEHAVALRLLPQSAPS
jgi:alpha-L-fucosidase